MGMGYGTRYKDCDPLKTIGRIRSILAQVGVLTREKWGQSGEGCYSLNLKIDGTHIFSNGKGTSPVYALASAYGEMIERLQNLAFVALNRGMGKEAVGYRGFCFAPDERLVSVEELLDNGEEWLSVFTGNAVSREEKKDVLVKWQSTDHYGKEEGFLSLPYFNITEGKMCIIPEVMLINMYGSNGMCAGNTDDEALVQGLSEVFERHVMRKIVFERITPPTIPEAYIRTNFPEVYGIIKKLEGKGDFKVIVKDCSLGKGFPVLAVIFSDRKSHSYQVRFGAHPTFEIALERCLTELLQGNSTSDLNWLHRFTFLEEDINSFNNMYSIFTNGAGYFPAELFDSKYSYDFTEFRYTGGYDNGNMLSYLIDLLHANNCNILIRDVSFLGFPAFHIVVPFFSEIQDLNLQIVHRISGMRKTAEILMRLGNASDSELHYVIDYFKESGYNPYASIAEPLHRSLGPAFPWKNIRRDMFTSTAYYKMGEYRKAYHTMGCFANTMTSQYSDMNNMYFSCLRDYFGALAGGISSEAEISGILLKFYPDNIVDKVLSSLKNPDEVFKNCSRLDCFNCHTCQYIRYCFYPACEKLYIKLKDIYALNNIDQESIAGRIGTRITSKM
jgi:uncharacterized domain